MANSKLGWAEALYQEGIFTRKELVKRDGRKEYKYYDSEGVQYKRRDWNSLGATKEEFREKIRAYNKRQIHEAMIAEDPDTIDFESSKNRFSDGWNWD